MDIFGKLPSINGPIPSLVTTGRSAKCARVQVYCIKEWVLMDGVCLHFFLLNVKKKKKTNKKNPDILHIHYLQSF